MVNTNKTRVVRSEEGFDFLGHTFMKVPSKKDGKLKTYYFPSNKAMQSVKKKVKDLTKHSSHWSLPEVVERLNPILRGWGKTSRTV